MESIEVKYLACQRCGHKWLPRRPVAPKVCPGCNSPYWSRPRRKELATISHDRHQRGQKAKAMPQHGRKG